MTAEQTLERILARLEEPETYVPFRRSLTGYNGSVGGVVIFGKDATTPGNADGHVHCVDTAATYLVKKLYVKSPASTTGTINIIAGPTNSSLVIDSIPGGTTAYVDSFDDVSPAQVFFSITNSPASTDVWYIWWGG